MPEKKTRRQFYGDMGAPTIKLIDRYIESAKKVDGSVNLIALFNKLATRGLPRIIRELERAGNDTQND